MLCIIRISTVLDLGRTVATTILAMAVVSPQVGAVTDPVGDGKTSELGFTIDLVSASVEAVGDQLEFDVVFHDNVRGSFNASLDIDQNTATGFPGVFSTVESIHDGTVGTDYVVFYDTARSEVDVLKWIGNSFSTEYAEDAAEPSFSIPLSVLGADDGLVNYKIVAFQSSGAGPHGPLARPLDLMPDEGLPAATSIVPEPGGTILALWGVFFVSLARRHTRGQPVRWGRKTVSGTCVVD